jgi:hypothetical protein
MGVYQSGISLARVLAPFSSGAVYARLGHNVPFLLATGVALPAILCILAARRRHRLRVGVA